MATRRGRPQAWDDGARPGLHVLRVLAVIGRDWLEVKDTHGHRLERSLCGDPASCRLPSAP
jgi:hypothetical protein